MNIKKESTSVHPIGTYPTDFSKLCLDCLEPDEVGNFAHRQVYLGTNKSAELEMVKTRLPGGTDKEMAFYPIVRYKYCYYHSQKRKLLPYQKAN